MKAKSQPKKEKVIPSINGAKEFKMTIRPVKLENLFSLLSKENNFINDVQKTVRKCPPDEARFIPAPPDIVEDAKRRHNFQFRVSHAIREIPGRWKFRWIGYRKLFLLIREENFKAFASKFKVPGGAKV